MNTRKKPFGIVIMGPSGVGKTTIAQLLAQKTSWIFAEADEFHPIKNKEKMAAGIPLDDKDRMPWLHLLKDFIDENAKNGKESIVTCSALKYIYRDVLKQAQNADIFFIELYGCENLVEDRISKRSHDYMPPSLLHSQYEILESLNKDENGKRFSISFTPDEIVNSILNFIHNQKEK